MFAKTPQQVYELWVDAFNRADRDAMAQLFEEDVLLLAPPGDRLVRGRTAVADTAWQTARHAHVTMHRVDVLEQGDLAMVYATRTVTLTLPGAESVERTATATDVVRRQADGRWLIAIDNPNGVDATSPASASRAAGRDTLMARGR